MMKASELKVGDEVLHNPVGSSANMIREVYSITSGVVYFQGTTTPYTFAEIESGRFQKLEKIRGSKSVPAAGDWVRCRDGLRRISYIEKDVAFCLAGPKIPKDEIHYDTDNKEFWYLDAHDVRAGDVVLCGKARLKVESVDIPSRKVKFGDNWWTDANDISVDSVDRCYLILDKSKLIRETPNIPKHGDEVIYFARKFIVEEVKNDTVYFQKGGTTKLKNLTVGLACWYIDKDIPFWDMRVHPQYTLCTAKDEEELNLKIRYCHHKGLKLWGPTQVKGDHYAQAMRT